MGIEEGGLPHRQAGNTGVFHGQTPHRPGKKRKPRIPAHPAKTVAGRRQIKVWINSIHRESLNGETAHAYDSRLAQAA